MSYRVLIFAGIVFAIAAVLDLVFPSGYGSFAWSGVPGFFALFGFAGCVIIILVSKWLGKAWLQRDEDYYGSFDREDRHE